MLQDVLSTRQYNRYRNYVESMPSNIRSEGTSPARNYQVASKSNTSKVKRPQISSYALPAIVNFSKDSLNQSSSVNSPSAKLRQFMEHQDNRKISPAQSRGKAVDLDIKMFLPSRRARNLTSIDAPIRTLDNNHSPLANHIQGQSLET